MNCRRNLGGAHRQRARTHFKGNTGRNPGPWGAVWDIFNLKKNLKKSIIFYKISKILKNREKIEKPQKMSLKKEENLKKSPLRLSPDNLSSRFCAHYLCQRGVSFSRSLHPKSFKTGNLRLEGKWLRTKLPSFSPPPKNFPKIDIICDRN